MRWATVNGRRFSSLHRIGCRIGYRFDAVARQRRTKRTDSCEKPHVSIAGAANLHGPTISPLCTVLRDVPRGTAQTANPRKGYDEACFAFSPGSHFFSFSSCSSAAAPTAPTATPHAVEHARLPTTLAAK